jgi:arylsulfatase A-like enzyme
MVVTYRWEATPNPFGVPGTQWVPGGSVPRQKPAGNGHGGLNPYVTHSTLLAVGKDFQQNKTINLPAGNQDIAPTLLTLQGIAVPAALDGRVLSEALKKAPKARSRKSSTRRLQVSSGNYCAELEVSYADDHAYLDQAQRCPAKP